jgi:CRISPR-associated protein Csb2
MTTESLSNSLLVSVSFPRWAYSGGELGTPEELPSPARVHAALVSAAGGGPSAHVDGRCLVADPAHERALRWLEEHEPVGVIAPAARLTEYRARRFRLRAAANHPNETDFDPFSALAGPIVYAWPQADTAVLLALQALAPEVTHVGTADSIAIVHIKSGEIDLHLPEFLRLVPGRGPGRELRVAGPGRFGELVEAHRRASRRGGHTTGSGGKQAADESVDGAGDRATRLRRFAPSRQSGAWPFSEVWRVPLSQQLPRWTLRVDRRVAAAVTLHRALIAAIGTDVPAFVTGRDGDRPLQGGGHLAIHLIDNGDGSPPEVVFALPQAVPEADRALLLEVLGNHPTVRIGGRAIRLGMPEIGSALPFWPRPSEVMATDVPMVLDTPGVPRNGPWTLDDAVICSIGYALRAVLEAEGIAWGTGWAFRHALVASLRERGVLAHAQRVTERASLFTHRAREGDLLIAAHATVALGDLAAGGGGLLALGRARHLGGGLLRPVIEGGG